jgi:thiamine-phosphate pyrophosphorylase
MEEVICAGVEGGVNAVVLREHDLPAGDLYDLAVTLRYVLRGHALFLVNDRVDIALATGADGVHLPERSLPGKAVRALAGESCLIGRSVHNVEVSRHAEADGLDYVQAGAVFQTASHPGQPAAGLELIRAVAGAVHLPVIAVGGIDASNVGDVIAAGADGVAVISAVWDAPDPRAAARTLRAALDESYAA